MVENALRKYAAVAAVFAFCLLGFTSEATAQTSISNCGPINDPGAYILTNNLVTSGDCLTINANNVSIDLSGFTIFGDGTGNGIVSGVNAIEGFTVRNGTVKGFDVGMSLFGNTMLIDHVQLIRNTTKGLGAIESITVKDSTFAGNGIGLSVGQGSVLIGNTVNFNTSDGMQVNTFGGSGSTVINNSVRSNGGMGIVVACPSNIIGNTATSNTGGNLVLQGVGCNSNNNVAP